MEATTHGQASGPVTVGVSYAAGYLGVHKNTVYRWIKTKKLAARFYLGAWRIDHADLLKAASSDQRRTHD